MLKLSQKLLNKRVLRSFFNRRIRMLGSWSWLQWVVLRCSPMGKDKGREAAFRGITNSQKVKACPWQQVNHAREVWSREETNCTAKSLLLVSNLTATLIIEQLGPLRAPTWPELIRYHEEEWQELMKTFHRVLITASQRKILPKEWLTRFKFSSSLILTMIWTKRIHNGLFLSQEYLRWIMARLLIKQAVREQLHQWTKRTHLLFNSINI